MRLRIVRRCNIAAPRRHSHRGQHAPRNPLEITAAAFFALLFVVISIATEWARAHFGAAGVDTLAAVVGFTDIDPFVLSIAQGGSGAMPMPAAATAILIAIALEQCAESRLRRRLSPAGARASTPAAVLVALGPRRYSSSAIVFSRGAF